MDKIWLGFFDCAGYTDTFAFKNKELADEWFDKVTAKQTEGYDDKLEKYVYREEDEDIREFLLGDNPCCDWVKIAIANVTIKDNLDGMFAEEDPNE